MGRYTTLEIVDWKALLLKAVGHKERVSATAASSASPIPHALYSSTKRRRRRRRREILKINRLSETNNITGETGQRAAAWYIHIARNFCVVDVFLDGGPPAFIQAKVASLLLI